jgi:CheY-like chemotaxis protein
VARKPGLSDAIPLGLSGRSNHRASGLSDAIPLESPGQSELDTSDAFLKETNTMNITVKRILLAEDSDRDAELTINALVQHNLANEAERVRDGAEALDYLYHRGPFSSRLNGHPALVLLDLKLPKIGGLEVLQQIRSDPQLKLIPVVVMTSSSEEQDVVRSYELGANAYVVKPVKFNEFVHAVKQVEVFWAVINEPPPVG